MPRLAQFARRLSGMISIVRNCLGSSAVVIVTVVDSELSRRLAVSDQQGMELRTARSGIPALINVIAG
jgi:hypothetical protein